MAEYNGKKHEPGYKGKKRTLGRPRERNEKRNEKFERHRKEGGGSRKPRPRKPGGRDGRTRRRMRDDRLFGALCHGGIFLGIWGLVTTGVIWAFRKDESRVLRLQGAQALLYQGIAQLIFFGCAIGGVLWVAGESGVDGKALVSQASEIAGSGVVGALAHTTQSNGFLPLLILKAFFGVFAFLALVLCLTGLEPSYPLVGLVCRKVLRLRSSREQKQKQDRGGKEDRKGTRTTAANTGK